MTTSVGSRVMLGGNVQTHFVGISLRYNVGVVERGRNPFVRFLSLEQCGRLFSECVLCIEPIGYIHVDQQVLKKSGLLTSFIYCTCYSFKT